MSEKATKDLAFSLKVEQDSFKTYYIRTQSNAEKAINRIVKSSAKVLGLDIETGKQQSYLLDPAAGLCPYRSFISLLQFYVETESSKEVFMFDIKYLPIEMFQSIFDVKRVIAHNAIFDLQHLRHHGIKNVKIDCSMVMYNMVRCAQYGAIDEEEAAIKEEWGEEEGDGTRIDWLTKKERYSASLRSVTAKLLGIYVDKDLQVSNWTDRPLSKEQLIYAAKDSLFTYKIGKILSRDLVKNKLEKVYRLNRQAHYPITTMILNGSKIDTKAHKVTIEKWVGDKERLEKEVLKQFDSVTNLNSPKQIGVWLTKNLSATDLAAWPRSEKTKSLQTGAKALTQYKHLPFANSLLEYKHTEKLITTYGESLLDRICPVTKRLHGSFTLGYTHTGRLSSRNPNLQNLPRGSDLRSIFVAEKGNVLVGADYSQIELRVAAELSGDKTMKMAFRKGIDLHSFLASKVLHKSMKSVTKEDRQLSKSLHFGLLFGLGPKGLIEYSWWNYGVRMGFDDATDLYNAFFDLYKGLKLWQGKARYAAEHTALTTTRLGKRRKLGESRYTIPVNHPVQGSAAEVVITALNLIEGSLPSDCRMINCIHDEIILEVPRAKADFCKIKLADLMTAAMRELFPNAPLNGLVDAKIGKSWMEIKG